MLRGNRDRIAAGRADRLRDFLAGPALRLEITTLALGRQVLGDRAADAAARSGDDGDFAIQPECVHCLSSRGFYGF